MTDNDDVERVARAVFDTLVSQTTGRAPKHDYDDTLEDNREAARDLARAALSAMPPRELLREALEALQPFANIAKEPFAHRDLRRARAALFAEYVGYVGERQAFHSLSMIAGNNESFGMKPSGLRWMRQMRTSLLDLVTRPQLRTIYQTSEETQSWGGFLSHDVVHVRAPSLRKQHAKEAGL